MKKTTAWSSEVATLRQLPMTLLLALLLCSGVPAQQRESQANLTLTKAESFPMRARVGVGTLRLVVNAEAGEAFSSGRVRFEAILTELDGSVVDSTNRILTVKPSSKTAIRFALRPRDYGYYGAVVRAYDESGVKLAEYATGFGVLRPLTERQKRQRAEDSMFGVNLHWCHNQGDLDVTPKLLHLAGLKWVRDEINWPSFEKEPGVYDLSRYRPVSCYELTRRKYGILTLDILCYANPLYPHASATEAVAYGNYAEHAARKLRGLVEHFELWNEPNGFGALTPQLYPRLMKSGFKGVKRGNPNAFVVGIGGASPGGWSIDYIDQIQKQDAAAFMDTFSIHPYTSPWAADLGYRTAGAASPFANLESARALTMGFASQIGKARGFQKEPKIWITEVGWPSNEVGFAGQAQGVARAYLTAAAMPDLYERVFIYDFICDGANAKEREDNFGVLGNDLSVRPAYVATAVASRAIAGRPFLRRIPYPDDSVHLYLFGPEHKPMLVGWVTEAGPSEVLAGKFRDGTPIGELDRLGKQPGLSRSVTLKLVGAHIRRMDWQGRITPLNGSTGEAQLELTAWPVYLTGFRSPQP